MARVTQKNQEQLITAAIIVGGGWAVLHFGGDAIKKFLSSLNPLADDPASTKKIQANASSPTSPWSPSFYKKAPAGTSLLTEFQAKVYTDRLLNSVGYLSDNFSMALGVFKAMKTQSQVSYLADYFFRSQGQDLLTWLQGNTYPVDRFSDQEVEQMIDYVDGLPKYKP